MENKSAKNLNLTYSWFDTAIGNGVREAVNSYFENSFNLSLISLNDSSNIKSDPLLKGELFWGCQVSIKNKQYITMRVTSDFIRIVFHKLFGSEYPVFDLEKLTELETRILNGFFEYIVRNIEQHIIKDTEQDKIDVLNKKELNLTFLIHDNKILSGKLSVLIPLNRIAPLPVPLKQNFSFEDFVNNYVDVDIITGYAKISLNDLKNLSKDDILVLEKSDIKIMSLNTETIKKDFKVNLVPSIVLDVDEDEDEEGKEDFNVDYKEEIMPENKTMWDDIQIEVCAEFKKVKMTLGELKQISNGVVIDVGDVVKNEISLLVENKVVAKGELVIINDKYGVKVNEVFASKKEETPPQRPVPPKPAQKPPMSGALQGAPPPRPIPPRPAHPQGAPMPQGAPKAPPQRPVPPKPAQNAAQNNKDDFDYSNFEE